MLKRLLLLTGVVGCCAFGATSDVVNEAQASMAKFTNPIGRQQAADPFVTWDGETGYFYLLFTRSVDVRVYRSRTLAGLREGENRLVYTPRDEDGIYGHLWAPEMHRGPNGKWYIYSSGAIKQNEHWGQKRLIILESKTRDPFDGFIYRGKPAPELFAIDPTMLTQDDGRQYICYSEVKPERGQVLVIREMVNPWTFGERQAEIAHAELPWELVNHKINEGAFFVRSPDRRRLFIVYSGNGCYCDDYALGVLEHMGGDLCDAKNWKKHPKQLLVKGPTIFGPGHASFFRSPDGKTLWCAYHGLRASNPSLKPASRWLNVQRVDFDATGYPVMGVAGGSTTKQN